MRGQPREIYPINLALEATRRQRFRKADERTRNIQRIVTHRVGMFEDQNVPDELRNASEFQRKSRLRPSIRKPTGYTAVYRSNVSNIVMSM